MATWRLRRKWRLRREAAAFGKPFDTSAHERSEALANGITWKQELLFTVGAPLLGISIVVMFGLAIYSLWGLLH